MCLSASTPSRIVALFRTSVAKVAHTSLRSKRIVALYSRRRRERWRLRPRLAITERCAGCRVLVMPDHVHLLLTPLDGVSLAHLMSRLKGASAHRINQLFGSTGAIWQRESFDHILRSDESIFEKAEYIRDNPVRKGLVDRAEDWLWFWRA